MDNHTLHYRPQSSWQPGTTITLHAYLYGVDLGNGVYGQTDRTATYTVHDSWIAKADGATEQMQIFHNGALVNTMPISLGSPGFPSHSGPHVISDKQPSVIMDSCTYGVCPGQPGYYRERVDLDERISNDGEFVHSAPWSIGRRATAMPPTGVSTSARPMRSGSMTTSGSATSSRSSILGDRPYRCGTPTATGNCPGTTGALAAPCTPSVACTPNAAQTRSARRSD